MSLPPSSPLLAVEGLSVRYPRGQRPAVDEMSFEVPPGEVFGLLGPNGAGKSTTQRVLTLLLRRYSGRVSCFGRPLEQWGPSYYERIGVSFELPANYGKLSARENLEAFAALYAGPTEQPLALLQRLDLAEAADVRAADLSKGMAVRLNLARALLHRPDLLFLDEPTSGLDPTHAAGVRDLIRAEAAEGRTVFVTTHDMRTADEVCDRVAFVVDGRVVRIGAPRDLKLAHGRQAVTVEHRGATGLERSEFPLVGLGADQGFLSLLNSGTVETIHTREATLDDVFTAVTGRTL